MEPMTAQQAAEAAKGLTFETVWSELASYANTLTRAATKESS